MKFSFLTYQFCRYPLKKCFELANRYSFEGVEVWGARPHAYAYDVTPNTISQISQWKKEYNVEVSMFTPEILAYPYSLTSPLQAEYKETIDYLLKSLEVAAGMEAPYMQVTCPHPGYDRDMDQVYGSVVSALQEISLRAKELGVTIVMEALSPSEGNLLTTACDLKKIIRDVGCSAFKGMLDVVPPVIANEPFSEYFDLLSKDMAYIHICNSDGKTEFHSQLDDGCIPFIDMFQIFKNYNYTGWCSIELLNPYFKDPELYLAQSARLLRKVCKELSI